MGTSFETISSAGAIRLGGIDLPGHEQAIRVEGTVFRRNNNVPGRSGAYRQPLGYEDATVALRLLFLDNEAGRTELTQLYQMESLFKAVDSSAKPEVVRLVNAHTAARGIVHVVWSRLSSRESVDRGGIEATIELLQHRPEIIEKELAAIRAKKWLQEKTDELASETATFLTNFAGGHYVGPAVQGVADSVTGSAAWQQLSSGWQYAFADISGGESGTWKTSQLEADYNLQYAEQQRAEQRRAQEQAVSDSARVRAERRAEDTEKWRKQKMEDLALQ